jgi:hypothetical protein
LLAAVGCDRGCRSLLGVFRLGGQGVAVIDALFVLEGEKAFELFQLVDGDIASGVVDRDCSVFEFCFRLREVV